MADGVRKSTRVERFALAVIAAERAFKAHEPNADFLKRLATLREQARELMSDRAIKVLDDEEN